MLGTMLRMPTLLVSRFLVCAPLLACSSSSSPVRTDGGHTDGGHSPAGDAAAHPTRDAGKDAQKEGDDASADATGRDADASADVTDSHDAGPGSLSYMIGIKTNGVPTGPAKVESWLGRPLD